MTSRGPLPVSTLSSPPPAQPGTRPTEQAPRILCSWGPTPPPPPPPAGLQCPGFDPRSSMSGRISPFWAGGHLGSPSPGTCSQARAAELASWDPRRRPGWVTSLGLEQK